MLIKMAFDCTIFSRRKRWNDQLVVFIAHRTIAFHRAQVKDICRGCAVLGSKLFLENCFFDSMNWLLKIFDCWIIFRNSNCKIDSPVSNQLFANLRTGPTRSYIIFDQTQFLVIGGYNGYYNTENCLPSGATVTCTYQGLGLQNYAYYPELLLVNYDYGIDC